MKQLFKLVNQYAPLKYKAFLTLAVYSGFRNGELMGLERKEADWENNERSPYLKLHGNGR